MLPLTLTLLSDSSVKIRVTTRTFLWTGDSGNLMCPALDSAMLLLLPGTLLMWPKSLLRLFDDETGETDKAFNEGLLLLRTLLCTNPSLIAELCILIGRSSVDTEKFRDYFPNMTTRMLGQLRHKKLYRTLLVTFLQLVQLGSYNGIISLYNITVSNSWQKRTKMKALSPVVLYKALRQWEV